MAGSPLFATTAEEFYENLYKRGLAHFQNGSYETAIRELRLAAFGLIEVPERFAMAQAYVVAAAERLNRTDEARVAMQKIVAAEHVQRRFSALDLPPDVRGDVDKASALLSPAELAYFRSNAAATGIARTAPRSVITVPDPIVAQPQPQPPPKPVPQPPAPQPIPVPQPKVEPPAPQPQPPAPQPAPRDSDVAKLIADGDRAIAAGDLIAARDAYTAALQTSQLPHATLLKLGEGLYRARAFRDAATAFDRAGAFAKGEGPFRYYYAVALYETGRYAAAKRELAAALPSIEVTPDVARYRQKIEGAIE